MAADGRWGLAQWGAVNNTSDPRVASMPWGSTERPEARRLSAPFDQRRRNPFMYLPRRSHG